MLGENNRVSLCHRFRVASLETNCKTGIEKGKQDKTYVPILNPCALFLTDSIRIYCLSECTFIGRHGTKPLRNRNLCGCPETRFSHREKYAWHRSEVRPTAGRSGPGEAEDKVSGAIMETRIANCSPNFARRINEPYR